MVDPDLVLSMLERPCPCTTRGPLARQACGQCNGSGKALTDLGHEVIDFVARHLRSSR